MSGIDSQRISVEEELATLTRECDEVIEGAMSQLTESQREFYQRDLRMARWVVAEVDRKEVTTPKPWAYDRDLLIIVSILGFGVLTLLLSFFPGMRETLEYVTDRSLFIALISAPLLLWSFCSIVVTEIQKRIDTQTLEFLWERWCSLGLSLDLLSDTIQYGKWKFAENDAVSKKYGATLDDPNFREVSRALLDFQLRVSLINRSTPRIESPWRYVERFWDLQKRSKRSSSDQI